MNCRTHEHRHFERTLRSSDTIPGPLLAEGRLLLTSLLGVRGENRVTRRSDVGRNRAEMFGSFSFSVASATDEKLGWRRCTVEIHRASRAKRRLKLLEFNRLRTNRYVKLAFRVHTRYVRPKSVRL